ncbi:Transposon Ty3-I Gag-Pol polyprotein [Vitis vinifera]|uniref:Transposon Ty3-I Gag-Pol polyprotein n=1 Tax=Vitis vinifera TaxID=29760 RepID=A0A438ICR8_VITVI|nr:Transposon Ty3-I Gag-Pol polyprotein [Vitis vinifera]
MSLMTLYFPDEINEHGTFTEIGDIVDRSVPRDEYVDKMLVMSMSQIEEIVQPELTSPFDLFGVFVIEIAEEILTAPTPESTKYDLVVDDLFDGPVGQVSLATRDAEIVDFGTADQLRELKIGLDLSTDERDGLARLLRSYLDVFALSYEDMLSLDPSLIQHHLLLLPHVRLVNRVSQVASQCCPCSKKDGKVRVCVDFQDLNKANPKDDFPLPHIDMLVDSTAGHSMLSFMDRFSRYRQILMAPDDIEKTSFITEWSTYCYRVMPFGLKNAEATYHKAATTLFHDMMHWDVEFRLRLNPKKYTFGVTSGKLLGYMVSERDIETDLDKMRVIIDMPALRTEREIRGFLGRLQYISRFIARLKNICEPIFQLLRKSQPTYWDDQCQRTFERIGEYLLSLLVLVPPTPSHHLL